MFEFGIFALILFAVVYWAVLFIMGRRNDVLHGEFVEAEPEGVAMRIPVPLPAPVAPPAPLTPARQNAASPPATNRPAVNPEALESLLLSLKQELKNAAKI